MADTKPTTQGGPSDAIAESLAGKLTAYVRTLPEEEQALLHHMLMTALPVYDRFRFQADDALLSEAERDLLDRLARE